MGIERLTYAKYSCVNYEGNTGSDHLIDWRNFSLCAVIFTLMYFREIFAEVRGRFEDRICLPKILTSIKFHSSSR